MCEAILYVMGMAAAAFAVWLAVRIINRHERWAKWTLAAVVGLPVLYLLSFGPACALADRAILPRSVLMTGVYRPCSDLALWGPEPARRWAWAWAEFCGGEFPLAEELVRELGEKHPDLFIVPSADFATDRMT